MSKRKRSTIADHLEPETERSEPASETASQERELSIPTERTSKSPAASETGKRGRSSSDDDSDEEEDRTATYEVTSEHSSEEDESQSDRESFVVADTTPVASSDNDEGSRVVVIEPSNSESDSDEGEDEEDDEREIESVAEPGKRTICSDLFCGQEGDEIAETEGTGLCDVNRYLGVGGKRPKRKVDRYIDPSHFKKLMEDVPRHEVKYVLISESETSDSSPSSSSSSSSDSETSSESD